MPPLNPFQQKRKKSPKQRTNLLPASFHVSVNREHCWIAYCEYGKVSITSKDKLLRITVSKKGGKYAQHITCKYDKYNNFRVYYSNHKGVVDRTYSHPHQHSGFIQTMLKSITNTNKNKDALSDIEREYDKRFYKIFNTITPKQPKIIKGKNLKEPISFGSGEAYISYAFSKTVWKLIYPLNDEHCGLDAKMPVFIKRAIRSHDPKELTRKLFGRSPKSLVKAVIKHLPLEEHTINTLFLAKVFYGIWPLDKVVEFLNYDVYGEPEPFIYNKNGRYRNYGNGREDVAEVTHINKWRKFFRQFSYHKVLNWYKTYPENFGHYTKDTLRPMKELEDRGATVVISKKMDLKRIHDLISRHYSRLSRPEEILPVYDIAYRMNHKKIDNYTVVFPKTNYDLIEWGSAMHICVGSYAGRVKKGNSCIFTLQENGCPKYCVELFCTETGFKINQCKGINNSYGHQDIRDEIDKLIESAFNSDKIKTPKLIFPEEHKIEDITEFIDLNALENIQSVEHRNQLA